VYNPGLARQVLTDFPTFGRTGLVYERVRTAMSNDLASAAHQEALPAWRDRGKHRSGRVLLL
jgi:hypothetical protein